MQPVPDSGDGNPPGFSAGNNWKSLKLTPLLAEQLSEWKTFMASPPKVFSSVPRNPKRAHGGGYPRHRPNVRMRLANRLQATALRTSWRVSLRQLSWVLRHSPCSGCFSGGRVRPCTSNSRTRCSTSSHARPLPPAEWVLHSLRHSSMSGHARRRLSVHARPNRPGVQAQLPGRLHASLLPHHVVQQRPEAQNVLLLGVCPVGHQPAHSIPYVSPLLQLAATCVSAATSP